MKKKDNKQIPYLDEANPIFMVYIMRHKHHRHLWHIIIKVVHILDLHGVKERVRLRQVGGAAEPIRRRQQRLIGSTKKCASADVRGTWHTVEARLAGIGER
jgi:hypothetical protein